MVDAVTSQTLVDGERRAVMRFTNISDGTGESDITKVDVSTLNTNLKGESCTKVRIRKAKFSNSGMSVKIAWDADTDVTAIVIGSDSGELDFEEYGDIINNAGTGVTGDIKFSTAGQSANDTYDITLHMIKEYG